LEERKNPSEIREAINAKIDELFEFNQKVTEVLRNQARDFEYLAEFYGTQKQRCYDVVSMLAELAASAAETAGDIIMAEYGSSVVVDDDDEAELDGV